MSETPSWIVTRNARLKVYQNNPGLMAEELDYVFGTVENDDHKAVHNHIVEKIELICPNRNRLLINVARAVIETIKEQE